MSCGAMPNAAAIGSRSQVAPSVTRGASNQATSRPSGARSKVTLTRPTIRFKRSGALNGSAR